MEFAWGYVAGCVVTLSMMFLGYRHNEQREAEELEKDHNCKDYAITNWAWDKKLDDYKPDVDVCTKCGEIIYEY